MESFLTVLGDFILSGKGQFIEPPFFNGLGLGGEYSAVPVSALFADVIPGPSKKEKKEKIKKEYLEIKNYFFVVI